MATAAETFLAAVRGSSRRRTPMAGHSAPATALIPVEGGERGAAAALGAPGNALLAAIQAPVASGTRGGNLTAANRRAKNPRGLYRRAARADFARSRGLADNDWRTWGASDRAAVQEMGILPGADRFAEQFAGEFGREAPRRSLGSQLANIRWHGNPDGATMEVEEPPDGATQANAILEAVRKLRAANRRPQTYATRG